MKDKVRISLIKIVAKRNNKKTLSNVKLSFKRYF